jgi:hypothetical protein
LLAVHTPSPLAQGQSTVQGRSAAVLQTGLSVQTTSLVEVPALVWFWLALQTFQSWQAAALVMVEKVPEEHALHVRSLIALPAVAVKPAAQSVHPTHALRLADAVNVPLAQA